jgi:hypothetical protein
MPAKDEHLDDQKLTFGKHKFRTPHEIAEDDPSYIVWLYENINPKVVSKSLYIACSLDEVDDLADTRSQWD